MSLSLSKSPFAIASALLQGAQLCFTEGEVRRYALRPWGVGAVVYVVAVAVAIVLYDDLVHLFMAAPGAWWEYLLYVLVWLLCGAILVVATLVVTLLVVTLFLGFLQSAVAAAVLALDGIAATPVPGHEGARGFVRMSSWEIGKTIALALVLVSSIILAFFPIFIPLSVALAALVVALESFDVALDAAGMPPRERLSFARRNIISIVIFGLLLTAAGSIPLAGFLLPPIAVAAAARLATPILHSRLETLSASAGAASREDPPTIR